MDLEKLIESARERADPKWGPLIDFIEEMPPSLEKRIGIQSAHRGDNSDSLPADEFLRLITPALAAGADAGRELARLRERFVAEHRRLCEPDNCNLDGGPEHEIAFPLPPEAKETTDAR